MSFIGTAGATFIRGDENFTHGQGWSYVEQWEGGEGQIDALAKSLAAQDYQVDVNENPPVWNLTARRQARSDTQFVEFYDQFTITKEVIDKPLVNLEAVQTEIADVWVPTTGSPAQEYIQLVEDSVKECDTALLPDQGTYPEAWRLHHEMSKGQDSFEDEYIILTRERVVGVRYDQKLDLPERNISTIYTTDNLKAVFGILDFIGIAWTIDPLTAPTNTTWGWRSRHRRIEWVEGQKVIVSEDWAYAAWSNYIYNLYVAP